MKITMKFGGTSVGSVEALEQVISILQASHRQGHQVVAVVSAMSGITDRLIDAARRAEAGDEAIARQARQAIEQRHTETLHTFLGQSPAARQVLDEIRAFLDEFELLCHGIRVLGELTPRALDVISGLGERMNARQVAAILNARGLPAVAVDATELIVTDGRHGAATPLVEETNRQTRARLEPILSAGQIPVVTGFIGATAEGVPTTLGRGGSDYSATIIGRALSADEIWIWSDVDGVMTTDPRIVPNARTIPRLSYVEVGELAYFGAKVLHPRAIRPARQANIPVRMLNTFRPEHPGTLISHRVDDGGHAVKAVTAIKNMSLITIAGTGMIGIPGVAGRTFTAVARTGTSVLMISQSSSEQSICFVVHTDEVPKVIAALKEELARELERRDLDEITAQDDVVILAVVGAGMKGTPGISARVFGALGRARINVIAIAQGSSEYNISLVVARGDANQAVRLIHDEFALYE
ncbi:MAG: aspartate kinase [Caldilineae bacterium]|nr:MAG: aspartate kinase [Caldilineae bacterium]